jgi:hypothetical protein
MTDPTKVTTVEELERELGGFTGTINYYKSFPSGVYLTDGIKYVADRASAYWLFSDVSILIKGKYKTVPFQVWSLDVRPDTTARLTMREDSGEPLLHDQMIEYYRFSGRYIRVLGGPGVRRADKRFRHHAEE